MKKTFTDLGVTPQLCEALSKQRIETPTPIQEQGIPAVLSGLDVIAQAQTGTGKTLAFLLPIFQNHWEDSCTIDAMVITPTRELAIQITAEARKLAHFKHMNILAAYGGQDVNSQLRKLQGNIHLVIGTPGRILDHIRRGSLNLKHLKTLVLDEADQMLHIGFLPDVESIINHTPFKRQTLCFSATMPAGVKNLASRFLRSPVSIAVKTEKITLRNIKQRVIETTDREKQAVLFETIEEAKPFMAIIFCRTQRRVSTLLTAMHQKGYLCDELHGALTQAKRERVMKAFKQGKLQYLIATDIAARGLDIDGVTHVFNYDAPSDAENYIHRIGRTGRAGQTGESITFITQKDLKTLLDIEREINEKLPRVQIRIGAHHEDPLLRQPEHRPTGDRKRSSNTTRGKSAPRSAKTSDRNDRPARPSKSSDRGSKPTRPGTKQSTKKSAPGRSKRSQ